MSSPHCVYCGYPTGRHNGRACTYHCDLLDRERELAEAAQRARMRAWWTDRFTRDEILELAAGLVDVDVPLELVAA